jgi:thiamine biosynthesis lipoprotein
MQRDGTQTLHSFHFDAMGTECTLHLYSDSRSVADDTAEAVEAEVERIEARYSRYRPESLLSRINAAAQVGESVDVDDETATLLDVAFQCNRLCDGKFDISTGVLRQAWDFTTAVPPSQDRITALLAQVGMGKLRWDNRRLEFLAPGMELDFGGIAKEYAADRAAASCAAHGIAHGLVDFGGDLRILGPHPDGQPWHISIRDPRRPDAEAACVALADGALATSGDYERWFEHDGRRYCHILDPHTGWPARGLRSVSVVADQCLTAGCLATSAMLMGRAGIAWLAGMGLRYLCIDDEGRLHGSQPAL